MFAGMAYLRGLNTGCDIGYQLRGDNSLARIGRRKQAGQVQSSRNTATGLVLFLCCYTAACIPVNHAGSCFPTGPESCDFELHREGHRDETENTWCSWNSSNFQFLRNDQHVYLRLAPGQREGRLTSRTCCGHTSPGCLKFLYFFDVNDTIDLGVAVRYDGFDDVGRGEPEPPSLWTASSSKFTGWSEATIPVPSGSGNFQVVLEAKRRQPAGAVSSSGFRADSVYLDDIRYSGHPARCELRPLVAMTTPLLAPTTPLVAVTTPLPATSSSTGSGLAVGVTAAVVIVVVIIVVIAVVTRMMVASLLRRAGGKGEAGETEKGDSCNTQHC